MVNNGLMMSLKEFQALPQKEKLDCLFLNQVKSNKGQDDILKIIRQYKLHQKIQYPWLVTITMAVIFLIKMGVSS